VQEIGSLDDASGVRSLLAVSALHRVRDGARYPPTLFVSGATDYVLPLWQTGKLVARLQAAQGPDARALWRIDWQGGHGGASSNAVYARETALLYAFLLWRLGHPDFQPPAPPTHSTSPRDDPSPPVGVPSPAPRPRRAPPLRRPARVTRGGAHMRSP
jgi:prolyl oligopeptidase